MTDYKGQPYHSEDPDIFTKVERLNKLGQVVMDNPERFDMGYWFEIMHPDHPTEGIRMLGMANELFDLDIDVTRDTVRVDGKDCGTRACLAGWAVTLWGNELTAYERERDSISDCARKLLGLDYDDANALFDGFAHENDPEIAAQACRNLAVEAMGDWAAPLNDDD